MTNEVRVPTLPESVSDATVQAWHKQPGDSVKRDENLVDLETDKVVLEVPAPADGVLGEILADVDSVVNADDILGIIEPAIAVAPSKTKEVKTSPDEVEKDDDPVLTPAVRRLVKELDIDPNMVEGSGKDGRILKSDVMDYLDQQKQSSNADDGAHKESASQQASSGREEKRVPMSRLRARIADRLVEAQQTAAILTTFNEVNMKPAMDMREKYKTHFEKAHNTRLGFMSFFVKAAVEALKQYPIINASIDGQDILYHDYYDVGVAVSSPRGLVVPILRDVDQMSFADVESNIRGLAVKARDGNLSYDDLTGGTFTVTNGGVFGSMLSTPILNPPQSAILGMHNIVDRAVVENGEIVARPMMYLALSYDHRIIDGKEAVQCLVKIKELMEDPARMLLQV